MTETTQSAGNMTAAPQVTADAAWTRSAKRRRLDRLPDRVQAAIRAQEARSEVLIGWVQLAVLTTFALLYAVTPPAADSDRAMFQPVPMALATYFSFTMLRLILAYARFTPPWLLYMSVVVDIALLMGLIWSFHIQYQQPPSFYLKAPTILYVFIFITLRALRFDARYVIFAGVTAAVGWGVMVTYAMVYASMDWDDPITRDFVAYMTGNRILLGAEMDKIISILMVTAILALALIRARGLLIDAVREGVAAQELSRFFAPEAARAITGARRQIAAGEGEWRDAAILMIDIRGFSALTEEVRGDTVMRLLSDYHGRVVPIVRDHGGSVDKFLGDGVMVNFVRGAGEPAPAADALRALDAVIAEMADWRPTVTVDGVATMRRLRVNGAVATGRVVAGAVGDAERLEFTVIGSAVNLAAKLEKFNKTVASAALTTTEAYDLAVSQGYTRQSPPRRIDGAAVRWLGEPLDLVVLAEAAD